MRQSLASGNIRRSPDFLSPYDTQVGICRLSRSVSSCMTGSVGGGLPCRMIHIGGRSTSSPRAARSNKSFLSGANPVIVTIRSYNVNPDTSSNVNLQAREFLLDLRSARQSDKNFYGRTSNPLPTTSTETRRSLAISGI